MWWCIDSITTNARFLPQVVEATVLDVVVHRQHHHKCTFSTAGGEAIVLDVVVHR
jgi:hypothetical protein